MKNSATTFDLDDSLGFLLGRAASAMKTALEERLRRHDITAPQWAVLARLWEEDGLPPSVIGRRLEADRPTITGVVDRLEHKGLVKKVRDSEDRRVVRVHLTDRGKKLGGELPALAEEVNRRALSGIGDVEQLKQQLKDIRKNLWTEEIAHERDSEPKGDTA
jgi:DNA-binding MarR family transcriptional regulator